MDEAVFEPITCLAAAKEWASCTCTTAEETTVEQLHLSQLRQASDMTKLILVTDPIRGSRGFVLNISHTLISHGSYHILEAFILYLSHKECQFGIDRVFTPEDGNAAAQKLPQSLSNAYLSQSAAPTQAQMDAAAVTVQKAQERWTRHSIGIPTHINYGGRRSFMHNKEARFEDADFRAALVVAKREKVTLTALFFAAIAAAIYQRYSTGAEEGAHLLFSGNARRWIDIEGQPPVALSIVPGAMWLDKAYFAPDTDDRERLLRLARGVRAAQDLDLASEHIIGFYDQLAPSAAKATLDAQSEPVVVPPYCRPTMTSQGAFMTDKASGDVESSLVRFTNFKSGGRNTDPSVCFALYSCNGELRCNLLFDEKYFDEDEMMQLMYSIAAQFRRMIDRRRARTASTKL